MKKTLIKRSLSMIVAAYYLSRCGVKMSNGNTAPPKLVSSNSKWKEAYDFFYKVMGNGRSNEQFRNTMKNARDTFDVLFDNNRIGWIDKNGHQPSLNINFSNVHDDWKDRTDEELEGFVTSLVIYSSPQDDVESLLDESETEGGKRVYISKAYERNKKLRDEALRIHGFSCAACKFNFEEVYGSIGEHYAEVHHMIELAKGGVRNTDPLKDLIVLCSNCHRMVHRKKDTCLTIEELKSHINKAKLKHPNN
ncbi:TPA: HNH endonuclease [Serratia marcescens]|uniref:HNH endonuclease n=1 Tax=Serratia marcescens TaxID=615 RepID=UPI0023B17DA4|nr:HNH endonuclease [Serratia marcescens]WEE07082.1 HNH endonuclease [Serratia marcescens]WJD90210.1 HNH endonuclease [Serratia marcescens]HCD1616949.1 HNH endonuclease [Serratia marcescens]